LAEALSLTITILPMPFPNRPEWSLRPEETAAVARGNVAPLEFQDAFSLRTRPQAPSRAADRFSGEDGNFFDGITEFTEGFGQEREPSDGFTEFTQWFDGQGNLSTE
jgi:hypothetical protein